MASVNKVILVGDFVADADVRYLQGGTPVATFRMATTTPNDDQGKGRARTVWHTVVARGKQAKVTLECLSRGSQLYVEGELQTRECITHGGDRCYIVEVHVEVLQVISKRERDPVSDSSTEKELPEDHEWPDEIPF